MDDDDNEKEERKLYRAHAAAVRAKSISDDQIASYNARKSKAEAELAELLLLSAKIQMRQSLGLSRSDLREMFDRATSADSLGDPK